MRIIHIIGPVGVGKTTFIKKYLNRYPLFDIKDIYNQYQFKPKDLQNAQIYAQFAEAIRYRLDQFDLQLDNDLVIVESSGINKAMNQALKRYDRIVLWINSNFDMTILEERPYAKELNKIVRSRFNKRKIIPDVVFDWDQNQFLKPIPEEYLQFFPERI